MILALWIVQGVLGIFYLIVGSWKVLVTEGVRKRMSWAAQARRRS